MLLPNIKKLAEEQGMSLRELAAKSGVSVITLIRAATRGTCTDRIGEKLLTTLGVAAPESPKDNGVLKFLEAERGGAIYKMKDSPYVIQIYIEHPFHGHLVRATVGKNGVDFMKEVISKIATFNKEILT